MKKKIFDWLKKPFNIYMMILFIVIIALGILIPYGGDDWGNYLFHNDSFLEMLGATKRFYLSYEGRFFSRLLLMILVQHQYLWAIINASLMSFLYYMLIKIIGVKDNKFIYPLLLMCILFIDMQTFAQVYVWKTGNITYFIPMVFAVFLIYLRRDFLEKDKNIKFRKLDYLLIPLAFIFSMFVENVAVGIIMVCLLNLIYGYLKYKKVDKAMLFCLIASCLGFILMLISPGNIKRMAIENGFGNLSFFEKIIHNIPNLITYTFIKNSFLVLLMLIIMFKIIKTIKNKYLKVFYYLSIAFIPFITLIINILSCFITINNSYLKILLDTSRWYISLYWILFAILFILLIFYYFKSSKKKKLIYFIILALASNGAMMISPVWGGRTACFTTFMLYIVALILLFDMYKKDEVAKYIKNISKICLLLFASFLLIYCLYVKKLSIYRNKYINYQIENNREEYDIIILPGYWCWNLNTWGSDGDFAFKFKSAYGIDTNAKLNYVDLKDVKIDISKFKTSSKLNGY